MNEIFIDGATKENVVNKDYLSSFYNDDTFNLTFHFKSNFVITKNIRDCLIILLDIIWVESIWKNRFVLIIDELSNNSIEYGSKEDDINIIRFNSKKNQDKVYINIEVEDNWNWKTPKTAIEMEELRNNHIWNWFENHNSIRWRWLFLIITKLVDELYFKDSQNWWLIVWINKII